MKSITESSHITIVARDYAEKYTGTTNLEELVVSFMTVAHLLRGLRMALMVVILYGLMELSIVVRHSLKNM